jgi:hypothetical protein
MIFFLLKILKFLHGMKNKLIGVVFAVMGLLLGMASYVTQNPIEGLVAFGAITTSVAHLANVQMNAGTLFCVSLTNIPRSLCQKSNTGGVRKLLVALEEDFTEEWPTTADIDPATGTILTAPPLKVGKAFAEIVFTDDSAKGDYAKEGDDGHQGYKHMAECKVSGYTGPQYLALQKFLNVRVVVILKIGNRARVVYGTSEDGLSVKETHSTGAKGSDRNERTIKMEQNGLELAPPIMADAVVIPVLV